MELTVEDLSQISLALRDRALKLDQMLDNTTTEASREALIGEIHHCHSLSRRMMGEFLERQK